MAEIKLFNEWLETNDISTSAIALWYALMYIAWRNDWQPEFSVPVTVIVSRTRLCRSAVYKERNVLRDNGLIEFSENSGRRSSTYRIIGFEFRLVSTTRTQTWTQDDEVSTTRTQTWTQDDEVSTTRTQTRTQDDEVSTTRTQTRTQDDEVSTTRTQMETQKDEMSTTRTQTWTQNESSEEETQDIILNNNDLSNNSESCRNLSQSEKDPYISIYINKDIDKGGCGGKKKNDDDARSISPKNDAKSPKTKKPEFDLSFIGDGAWEALVSSWLEYKRSRSESYKSELSVKKFHTMLRNLSRGDPATARRIIDKSIANNWAGIFELSDSDSRPRGQPSRPAAGHPATGQRIGQIKQPEDEERRRKLLEKFGSGKNPDDGSAKNKT